MVVQTHKQVAVIFTASFLYGLYITTLLFCFRWLLFSDEGWKRRKSINWPMVAVTACIFLLTAVYLSISLASTMTAVYAASYIPHDLSPHSPINPIWYAIVQSITANLTALLADSVLVYRCWVVCDRAIRFILIPLILWVGGLVCTALEAYLQIADPQDPLVNPSHWKHVNMSVGPGIVLTPFWGSTAVLNAYCTAVLIYKIYSVAKACGHGASTRQLCFVIRILAESGFLYLSVTIAHFVVLFTTDDVAIIIVTSFNLPLIGIAFNLILIRTSENRVDRTQDVELKRRCRPSQHRHRYTFKSTPSTSVLSSAPFFSHVSTSEPNLRVVGWASDTGCSVATNDISTVI